MLVISLFEKKKKTFSICNTYVCVEKGVLSAAVISRREKNDFFPMAKSQRQLAKAIVASGRGRHG